MAELTPGIQWPAGRCAGDVFRATRSTFTASGRIGGAGRNDPAMGIYRTLTQC